MFERIIKCKNPNPKLRIVSVMRNTCAAMKTFTLGSADHFMASVFNPVSMTAGMALL